MTKSQIRTYIKAYRQQIDQEYVNRYSEAIVQHILALTEFEKAPTLFLYAAFEKEVQTSMLHAAAVAQGKKIAYPKIGKEPGEMAFYEVRATEELEENFYGTMRVREPNPQQKLLMIPQSGDLMIVPGVAFDSVGNRIGYGGGYYDRYLQHYPTLVTIGVGFSFQIVEVLPSQSFDQVLHRVITP